MCLNIFTWLLTLYLCAEYDILTGHGMMNLASNVECLFSIFFQPTLKSDLKDQNYFFGGKAPL